MKKVSLTDLKNNFSSLIDLVKRGKESLLVCERDIPVIKVIWAGHDSSDVEGEDPGLLRRLERAGHLVRSNKVTRKLKVEDLVVTPSKKADALKALIEEREEGR